MKKITITFIMSNATFMWIWGIFSKEGGKFNEFLVDYYIHEIAKHFPDVDKVTPKIFGVTHGIKLLFGGGTPDIPLDYAEIEQQKESTYSKLKEEFIVEKSKIINPVVVGI